jgi:hypothetical protein
MAKEQVILRSIYSAISMNGGADITPGYSSGYTAPK